MKSTLQLLLVTSLKEVRLTTQSPRRYPAYNPQRPTAEAGNVFSLSSELASLHVTAANASLLKQCMQQERSPKDSLVFFFRDGWQARVSQPADARVCMVIDNAVEGAIDAVTDIVIKHLVAAAVLPHSCSIDVQHQAG